jgi:2-(1,2-epoxy-1,2-dihydrophenyl)acetyl-CoA isomerase
MTHSLSETIAFEAGLQKEMVQTEDHKEGLEAFLEKRAPDFSGH